MYLKSGALRAYGHCPEQLFERDIRKRFGHRLVTLAEEVEFPVTPKVREQLQTLTTFIEEEARYPITPQEGVHYTKLWNKRTAAAQDDKSFREYCQLVREIRNHVGWIDQDEKNPSVFMGMKIGADGFLTFRMGGNLSPRVTYKPSALLIKEGQTTPDDIKNLLDPKRHVVLLSYWDEAVKIEDKANGKGTYRHPPKTTA